MSKTALVFPGQGSQVPGMGRELAEHFPAARQVFEQADRALDFPISKLCFEGPEADLKLTENTQPAMLTCSLATLAVLTERGLTADYVAGHSLGEYSALVAGGSLRFEEAVRLVRNRGRYMQKAVPEGVGAMAALLGLPDGELDSICTAASNGEVVSAANFNAPGQVVIAGHAGAVSRAVELAKARGARKAVLLSVSAPFHCALMKPAQERLAGDFDEVEFKDLRIPLVNNYAAREIRSAEQVRQGLNEQVTNPVLWEQSVRYLAAQGVDHFIEVGPGKVLTALLKRIDRSLKGSNVQDLNTLEKLAS